MDNEVARLLSKARESSGKSLRDLKEISGYAPQTLHNYERGIALPPKDSLPTLARIYEVEPPRLQGAYELASRRAASAPLSMTPFLSILENIRCEDHIIVITQKTLLDHQPELADEILKLLQKEVKFTYVAYYPAQGLYPPEAKDWQGNHVASARILWMARNRWLDRGREATESVNYLLIGKPSARDYAFLRAFGAWIYLYSLSIHDYEQSLAWSEVRSIDGKHWWQLCDEGFCASLYDWLVRDCGLLINDIKRSGDIAARLAQRDVRHVHLEKLMEEP